MCSVQGTVEAKCSVWNAVHGTPSDLPTPLTVPKQRILFLPCDTQIQHGKNRKSLNAQKYGIAARRHVMGGNATSTTRVNNSAMKIDCTDVEDVRRDRRQSLLTEWDLIPDPLLMMPIHRAISPIFGGISAETFSLNANARATSDIHYGM
jgi:hypothetical protein